MKKTKTMQLALLGLANGLLFNVPSTVFAKESNEISSLKSLNISAQKTYLAASCGAKCGSAVAASCASCGNAVAVRDLNEGTTLKDPSKAIDEEDPNSGNLGYHLLTEDELLLELNDAGVKQYKALTPEGQALAKKLASQRCAGTNDCKGENACKTDKNSCRGQGTCKGTTVCAFSDKNDAIRVAAKKMAEKRNQTMQGYK